MSITSALSSALTGLRYSQDSLSVASANIANAETEGYTKKSLEGSPLYVGDRVAGVETGAIRRTLDTLLQKQSRTSVAALEEATVVSDYYGRLDALFGVPGGPNALDTLYNAFSSSFEALATNPESGVQRQQVITDAQVLSAQLNQFAADIVDLREEAEREIGASIANVNDLLSNIQTVDTQIQTATGTGAVPADLLDQRDNYIDQLSELIEIRVEPHTSGTVSIMTSAGVSLFDRNAVTLDFDEFGSLNAASKWSSDTAERTVGTIRIRDGQGFGVDLIANNAIRSGKVAGLLELRDEILVDVQARLDEMAHSMALALSNTPVAGTAVTVGLQEGQDIDLTGIQPGNIVTLDYDNAGTQETVSIVDVRDPAFLPLDDTATARTDDIVIGVDFSAGFAAAAAAIDAALGANVTVSNPSGSVLRFLDDGAAGTSTINTVSAEITQTSLTGGTAALPFFVDGIGPASVYTGALEEGPEKVGFAGRITLNGALEQDPSLLITYDTAPLTFAGDSTRPSTLADRLNSAIFAFDPTTGIGTQSNAFTGSIGGFVREVINRTAAESATASTRREGQDIVVNNLQKRIADKSGVDVDFEIARLTMLQNLYAANARVITVAQEMIDTLIRI